MYTYTQKHTHTLTHTQLLLVLYYLRPCTLYLHTHIHTCTQSHKRSHNPKRAYCMLHPCTPTLTNTHTFKYIKTRIYTHEHTHDRILLCIYHTGWRRPIGCLKLLVIYRKRATNHRVLLRRMTCKDKASYGSWPLDMYDTYIYILMAIIVFINTDIKLNTKINLHE